MFRVNSFFKNYRQISKIFSQNFITVTKMNEEKQLVSLIRKTFNDEKCDVKFTSKTISYLGDVIFAKVDVNDDTHHIVVKIGKNDAVTRRTMPIREAVQREIFFYNNILPTFNALQIQKNVKEPFNAVPKYYSSFLDETTEVVILENLKSKGYELHRGSVPLNVNHLKLGLKNLAKFHGLSFALRDQKPEIFVKLTENLKHVFRPKIEGMKNIYNDSTNNVLQTLKDANAEALRQKYEKFVERGADNIFLEILDNEPKEMVVTHCDCHNYNFLFKYKDHLKEDPLHMMIIDYHLSCLHSPVLDVSFFWYTGVSKNEIPHLNELLEFYHQELSTHLDQLGSDPNKIFPLSKLWDHWEKYSKFGFLVSSLHMNALLFEREAKVLEEEFGNVTVDQEQLGKAYSERLKTIVGHFFSSNI